ncbi:MAG TPA: hypothetical protein VF251_07825 [Pyrinomonadaceae bacterium]
MSRHVASSLFVLSLILVASTAPLASGDKKMLPSDVISKHLDSIGPAEQRARVTTTKLSGTCTLVVKEGGAGQAEGQALMASKGDMNMLQMTFTTGDPAVWVKFDGTNATVSQFRPGRRTSLENFLAAYDVIFREGLLGGTLSKAWPFLHMESKNPKLDYAGLKKIDGKEVHALKYVPRHGADLKITLYFMANTFEHVRTEYEQTIYPSDQQRIGAPTREPGARGQPPTNTTPRSTPTRITATEDFSNFRIEEGLNLPHKYKFQLSIQSDVRPALINWVLDLTQFSFNEPVDFSEPSGSTSN